MKFSVSGSPQKSEDAAMGAALAIVSDIRDVDGVSIASEVIEQGGRFIVRLVIVIPPEVTLNEEQHELISNFTDLDSKGEEFSGDFEEVEDPNKNVLEAAGATVLLKEEQVENDTIVSAEQYSGKKGDINVEEDNIPEMAVIAAPSMVALSGNDNDDETKKDKNLSPKTDEEPKLKLE